MPEWTALLTGFSGGVPVAFAVWLVFHFRLRRLEEWQDDHKADATECRHKREAEEQIIHGRITTLSADLNYLKGRCNGHAKA